MVELCKEIHVVCALVVCVQVLQVLGLQEAHVEMLMEVSGCKMSQHRSQLPLIYHQTVGTPPCVLRAK